MGYTNGEVAFMILIAIIVFVCILVITRELYCWLFKINESIRYMQAMDEKLGIISNRLGKEEPEEQIITKL